MASLFRIALYFGLLLISPEVLAGVFDPPPTDKSVSLLGIIFGANVGDIYLGGNPNTVLSQLMEKFNFIVVTVGLVVLSYVSIMATINTAQEGTAMGKKWSAIWIPMRSIAGMALMIPAPASGYSMIQVTVMWIVLQGIGAADQIWNIALDGLANGVSATTGSQRNDALKDKGTELAKTLLNAAICMESFYNAANLKENRDLNNWVAQKGNSVKSFVIDASTVIYNPNPPVSGPYGDTRDKDGQVIKKSEQSVKVTGTIYFGVNDSNDPAHMAVCGSIPISGEVSSTEFPEKGAQINRDDLVKAAKNIYETKQLAVSTMLSILSPLAEGLVNETTDADGNGISDGSFDIPQINGSSLPNPPGFLEAAGQAYESIMGSLVVPGFGPTNANQAIGSQLNSGTNNALTDQSSSVKQVIKNGMKNGWISAGSFYFIFNRSLVNRSFADANNKLDDQDSIPSLESCSGQETAGSSCMKTAYQGKNGNIDDVSQLKAVKTKSGLADLVPASSKDTLIQHLAYGTQYARSTLNSTNVNSPLTASSATASSALQGVGNLVGGANADIINKISHMLDNKNADPLIAHAILGRELMISAELIWLTSIALTAITAGFTGIWMALGIGPLMLIIAAMAVFWGFLGAMWSLGAMLAIYGPLIPFMIFTLAAAGWLLTVIEAIIAAPLIALGLTLPAGDEMGKLATALMLLANIFLRPMLMIFGFLLAAGLFRAIITLVSFGMADVFETIQVNSAFSSIAVLLAYVSFVISLENLSFSLIYAVPDKILRWLGGPADSTNVSALGETKAGTEKGVKATGEFASKQLGKAGNALSAAGKGGKAGEAGEGTAGSGDGGGDGTKPPE